MSVSPNPVQEFTLLSYNSLAPVYVKPDRYPIVSKTELLDRNERLMQQAGVIQYLKADIVLMQELQSDTAKELAEELAGWLYDSYQLLDTAWKEKKKGPTSSPLVEVGLGVFVRKGREGLVDEVRNTVLDTENGTVIQFIKLAGTNSWIANIHLDWERRAGQAASILNSFRSVVEEEDQVLAMVVGDYNGAIAEFVETLSPMLPVEQDETVQTGGACTSSLEGSIRMCKAHTNLTVVTYFTGGAVKANSSIDHAFVRESHLQASIVPITYLSGYPDTIERCLKEYGSDHVPVLFSCRKQ
jgi:endonuclease/exonuclease/phosphatase family metal-dependent hydrolase